MTRNNVLYNYNLLKANPALLQYYKELLSAGTLDVKAKASIQKTYENLKSQKTYSETILIEFSQLQEMHRLLQEKRGREEREPVYLHELMMLCEIKFPSAEPIIRSPELEAKLERLRLIAQEQDYQRMTRNVSPQKCKQDESFAAQMKGMNHQVTMVFNFLLTVLGAFAFGYKAVEYALPVPNIAMQLTVAICIATLVFFADVYFVIKDFV